MNVNYYIYAVIIQYQLENIDKCKYLKIDGKNTISKIENMGKFKYVVLHPNDGKIVFF